MQSNLKKGINNGIKIKIIEITNKFFVLRNIDK